MKGTGICCFTGHRSIAPDDIRQLPALLDSVLREMIASGVHTFRAGGAVGFDTLAALKVLEMRERYGDVRLELILPCRNQTERWGERDRAIYAYILERADSSVFLHERYVSGCMAERNRRLVDGSDFCIAFCNSPKGGTAYTVSYANQRGVTVINLHDLVK